MSILSEKILKKYIVFQKILFSKISYMKFNFNQDLKFGQHYEKEFLRLMKFKNYKHETSKVISDYDIIVYNNDEEIKYEIKADRLSHKTNNICIELTCNDRPSGLSITHSHYWGYFVLKNYGKEYDLYIIPTQDIKDLIYSNNFRTIRGGDKQNELILIPLQYFQKYLYTKNKYEINQISV